MSFWVKHAKHHTVFYAAKKISPHHWKTHFAFTECKKPLQVTSTNLRWCCIRGTKKCFNSGWTDRVCCMLFVDQEFSATLSFRNKILPRPCTRQHWLSPHIVHLCAAPRTNGICTCSFSLPTENIFWSCVCTHALFATESAWHPEHFRLRMKQWTKIFSRSGRFSSAEPVRDAIFPEHFWMRASADVGASHWRWGSSFLFYTQTKHLNLYSCIFCSNRCCVLPIWMRDLWRTESLRLRHPQWLLLLLCGKIQVRVLT